MLLISQATANKLYIVVDDVLTIESPVYLWRIYNEQTKQEHLVELANEKPLNNRFDLFTLTLPTDLDLDTGVFSWFVYESETPGDEDWANLNELSNGTMRVVASFTENSTYEPTGTDTVYNG